MHEIEFCFFTQIVNFFIFHLFDRNMAENVRKGPVNMMHIQDLGFFYFVIIGISAPKYVRKSYQITGGKDEISFCCRKLNRTLKKESSVWNAPNVMNIRSRSGAISA